MARFDYDDFSCLFPEASESANAFQSGSPVRLMDEKKCLQWVAAMAKEGEDINATGAPEWLACFDELDIDICLTPLAFAVIHGLTHTTEALLKMGADPTFSFNLTESGGEDVDISILDLAEGWSEAGYRAKDCFGLIDSALEAREISQVTHVGSTKKSDLGL